MLSTPGKGFFCSRHLGRLSKHTKLPNHRFCPCHRVLYHHRINRKKAYGNCFELLHDDDTWLERISLGKEAQEFCETSIYAPVWVQVAVWFAVFHDEDGTVSEEAFEARIRSIVKKDQRKRTIQYAKRHGWKKQLETLLENQDLLWYYTKCCKTLTEKNAQQREQLVHRDFQKKKEGAMTFKERLQYIERLQAVYNYGLLGNYSKFKTRNTIDIKLRNAERVYGVGLGVKPSVRELKDMLHKFSTARRLECGGYVRSFLCTLRGSTRDPFFTIAPCTRPTLTGCGPL